MRGTLWRASGRDARRHRRRRNITGGPRSSEVVEELEAVEGVEVAAVATSTLLGIREATAA